MSKIRQISLVAGTVVVVGALILGSTASAAVEHTAKAPKLGPMLLTINEMPTGWSVLNSSSAGGVGCLATVLEPKSIKQIAHASVSFAENGEVPEISEKLAAYSGISQDRLPRRP